MDASIQNDSNDLEIVTHSGVFHADDAVGVATPDSIANLTDIIGSMNPTPIADPKPSDYDETFDEAVDLTKTVLRRQIVSAYKEVIGSKIALERSQTHLDGRVVELPFSNGADTLKMIREENPEVAFAIFPDPSSGEWRIQQLPDAEDGSSPHLCEVIRVDGYEIPGFVFRHAAGFIGGAEGREGVLKMAELSLREAGLIGARPTSLEEARDCKGIGTLAPSDE